MAIRYSSKYVPTGVSISVVNVTIDYCVKSYNAAHLHKNKQVNSAIIIHSIQFCVGVQPTLHDFKIAYKLSNKVLIFRPV